MSGPPRTYIRVKCIPGIYAQHVARIHDGEPFAEIRPNSSKLRFPRPLKSNGIPRWNAVNGSLKPSVRPLDERVVSG
jgi:hypothetical protein